MMNMRNLGSKENVGDKYNDDDDELMMNCFVVWLTDESPLALVQA